MKKSVEKKIRKGGLVKLNAAAEANIKDRFRYVEDGEGCLYGNSKFTMADRDAYSADIQKQIKEAKAAGEDTWHITMRDDGESRLPPTSTYVKIFPGQAYHVLRARCVGYWNYRKHPGQCLVLDIETGREVYIPRHFVEAV